ncbi:XkdX family protein [Limosilactobacillus reuteri]|uniref:XkdX family protein n=1 Tax=Limosilactobacillus reuteri TaxID=1598 RepID=UPI0039BFA35A
MMTQVQRLQFFWNVWNKRDLGFYKVYVQCGAITKEDYKIITGQDYDTVTEPQPA